MNPSQDRDRSLLDDPVKVTPSLPPRGVYSDFDYRDPEDFVVTRGAPEVAPEMVNLADLDPQTKSRVVRAGAEARGLKIKTRDVKAAERFFVANPAWTAGCLLALMERCKRLGKVAGGFDLLWHAKMGIDFNRLLISLRKVLTELKVTGEFPALRDVPAEELYRPSRRKVNKGD